MRASRSCMPPLAAWIARHRPAGLLAMARPHGNAGMSTHADSRRRPTHALPPRFPDPTIRKSAITKRQRSNPTPASSSCRLCLPPVDGWPERIDHLGARFHVGPASQLDAVGDRPEDLVKRLPNGLWLAGQVYDQGRPTQAGSLPRQHGRGHIPEADGPHLLAVARQHAAAHSFGGLGGHVAGRRPRTARCDDQAAAAVVHLHGPVVCMQPCTRG
jgi:hypothetical protein